MDAGRPVTTGLFADVDGHPRLLGSRCASCGGVSFPRADICPYCATEGIEAVELSDSGALWAWTAVTAAPPGYQGPVPFGFGVVELPEGIRVLSLLAESDPAALAMGRQMRLVTVVVGRDDDGTDVVSYAFEAAS
jgi:uncharacterized OB-fold protein